MHMLQSLFYLTTALHVSSDKINCVTCAVCWDFCIRILLKCTDPCTLNLKLTVAFRNSVKAPNKQVPLQM